METANNANNAYQSLAGSTAPAPVLSERLFGLINETRGSLNEALKHQASLSDRLFGPAPVGLNEKSDAPTHCLDAQLTVMLSEVLEMSRTLAGNMGSLNSRI